LEDACRFDYSGLSAGWVYYLTDTQAIRNVGIEDLKVTVAPGDTCDNLIWINWAFNCWVRGVETEKAQRSHIKCSRSTHIEISGCYLHEATGYGGGWDRSGVFS
jgi:hypothetical protein